MAVAPKGGNGRTGRSHVISIQDVAQAASVSIATVSRAMNKPHLVSPETADRVRRVVDELGYRPNRFAQALMTRRSGVLAISLPDIHGEFYSELMRGADAEARERGYHLLVGSSHTRLVGEGSELVELASVNGLVDGVAVMITEDRPSLRAELDALGTPLVVIDAPTDGQRDEILIDHARGAREAAEHLLEGTAPERCYFLGGSETNLDTRLRASAFLRAFEDRGMRPASRQVCYGEYSIRWGADWAMRVLAREGLRGIAVFSANDEIAYGVLGVALDLGLGVPDDVRIIGFDGTRLAEVVRPTLSTVRVPRAEVGRAAIRALIRRINEPDAPPERVLLRTHLVVRQSSGI